MIGQRAYQRMHRPKGKFYKHSLSLVIVGIMLTVNACSYLPEYANPRDWFGSATGLVSGWWNEDEKKEEKFPNLATVPTKPELKSTVEELKNIKDKLISDRENARYSVDKINDRRSNLWPNSRSPIFKKTTRVEIPKPGSRLEKTGKKQSNNIANSTKTRKSLQKNNPSTLNSKMIKKFDRITSDKAVSTGGVDLKNLKFSIKNDQETLLSSSDTKLKFNIISSINSFADGIINFRHGSARLSSSALRKISRLAKSAIQKQIVIRIVGHASMRTREMDPFKHTVANFNISLKRANSVADAFIAAGLSADRLVVDAMGDSQPLFSESMPSGEKANRRAEIYLERS